MDTIEIYNILKFTINMIGSSQYGEYFVLKGGSALMTMLIEENQMKYFRRTTDIDLQISTFEVWEQFKQELISILNQNQYGIVYEFLKAREKSTETSDSITLIAHTAAGDFKFKIDMNVRPYNIISVDCLKTINLKTYDKYTMLSDKIMAISSKKIFRRIKDIYDICVLSQISEYTSSGILAALQRKNPDFFTAGENMLTPDHMQEIAYAYDRFTGIEQKPTFENLIAMCILFLEPIYSCRKELVWNRASWEKVSEKMKC